MIWQGMNMCTNKNFFLLFYLRKSLFCSLPIKFSLAMHDLDSLRLLMIEIYL